MLIAACSLVIDIINNSYAALNWQQVPEIPNASTLRVYTQNDSLYCGTNGLIFRYDHPENKWDTLAVIDSNISLIGAIIKVNSRLFVGSFNLGVFESTDNGLSWTPRNSGLTGLGSNFIIDFAYRGDSLYVGTAGAGVFVMNLNGPSIWHGYHEGMPDILASNVLSVYNHDNVLISGAGYNSTIYRNPQDTSGWTEYPYSDFDPRGSGMLDMTSLNGLVYGVAGNGFYISPDSGMSWERYNVNPHLFASGGVTADQDHVYGFFYYPIFGTFFYSSTGADWTVMDSIRAILTYDMAFLDGRIYIARQDGLWYADLDQSNSYDVDRALPENFIVSQNYPNPFNNSTILKYSTPTNSTVNIEIYDYLGRKLETLYNGLQTPGEHQAVWDAGRFSSGIYYYTISAGDSRQSNKMVLVK